eukprot:6192169-Pleurochrysis_carterae.AAC.1
MTFRTSITGGACDTQLGKLSNFGTQPPWQKCACASTRLNKGRTANFDGRGLSMHQYTFAEREASVSITQIRRESARVSITRSEACVATRSRAAAR